MPAPRFEELFEQCGASDEAGQRMGDLLPDVTRSFPFPADWEGDPDYASGQRAFLSGPFRAGWGLLATPTWSFAGSAPHPYRAILPVVPLSELVATEALTQDNVGLMRSRDTLANYHYVPGNVDLGLPDSAALLYRPSIVHTEDLPQPVARVTGQGSRRLQAKLLHHYAGRHLAWDAENVFAERGEPPASRLWPRAARRAALDRAVWWEPLPTEWYRQGDIFSPVSLAEPTPLTAEELEEFGAVAARYLRGNFRLGDALLLSPSCSIAPQPPPGESKRPPGYAHPVRVVAPLVTTKTLVERGELAQDELDELRSGDLYRDFFYVPEIPGSPEPRPERVALLGRPTVIHHQMLKTWGTRRVAQMSDAAQARLKRALAAHNGIVLDPDEFRADRVATAASLARLQRERRVAVALEVVNVHHEVWHPAP